jgi:hypothetical protein
MLLEAYDVARTLDDKSLLIAECNLGYGALTWGDTQRAIQVLEGARTKAQAQQDMMGQITCAQNLGIAMLAQGRSTEAIPLFREGGDLARRLGFSTEAAYCLEGLAAVLAVRSKTLDAARVLAMADRLHGELGSRREPAEQELYERTNEIIERDVDSVKLASARAEGAAMTLDHAFDLALDALQVG